METRTLVWIVASLVLVGSGLATPVEALGLAVRQEPLAPGTEVVVAMGAGSLSVMGWDRSEIEITSPTASLADSLQVRRETGKIVLEPGVTDLGERLVGELHLRLPHGSDLHIASTSAGIVISDMTGDLEIQTDAGNVDVSAPGARSLQVATVAGAVDVRAEADVLSLATVSGSIRFRGRGALNLTTVSGSMRIDAELRGTNTIRAVSARVDFEGSLAPETQLAITSHTGDVRLVLAERDPVRFELSTFDGRITRNGERVRVGAHGGEITFDLGGSSTDGRRVEIGTFSGEISLRHPGDG